MLIQALCEYYDMLSNSQNAPFCKEGFSKVGVGYLVALNPNGEIDEIIEKRKTVIEERGGKLKERRAPTTVVLPQRTEKTAIDANIIEHRPLFIFGLDVVKGSDGGLVYNVTDKSMKSHRAFVNKNLEFIDKIHSPLIDAYRKFLQNWNPDEESGNKWLVAIIKDYGKNGYAFCLSGQPELLLQDDPLIIEHWRKIFRDQVEDAQSGGKQQCGVTGECETIARIHSKIKGVYGGLATGSVLIGFNNESESSYGNDQSYNSNISETAMRKYTEALNYLLSNDKHRVLLDDVTIVFWAMSSNESCEDLFMRMLMGESNRTGADEMEQVIQSILEDARTGTLSEGRIQNLTNTSDDVDFFMVGLKPNTSRLSVKFLVRKTYADVLRNIAEFQNEIRIVGSRGTVPMYRIKQELVSPKSKNDKTNPALMSSLLEAIVYHKPLPMSLLETVIRRVKVDNGAVKLNAVRAGLIRVCINRNANKEEIKVALDRENHEPSYLCGRLFAVLEKLQQDASGGSLNRTIKDAYFASASAKPALVFPKLIRLAQNHLNKVKYPVYYNRQLEEIIGALNGEFPDTFLLKDQGKFIVGYYQQYQSFFEKSDKKED